jgi:hypothetical protein
MLEFLIALGISLIPGLGVLGIFWIVDRRSTKKHKARMAQIDRDTDRELARIRQIHDQIVSSTSTPTPPPPRRRRSAEQKDYSGSVEPDLVPGALRAYRHFQLHKERQGGMVLSAVGMSRLYRPEDRDPVGGVFQASCDRPHPFREELKAITEGLDQATKWDDDILRRAIEHKEALEALVREAVSHESPHAPCQCGFYASYDPQTDFYSFPWNHPFPYHFGELRTHDTWFHAVVEMSGRVLMGSRGVRAEKMKIQAIALDRVKCEGIVTEKHTAQFTALAQGLGIPYYEDAEKMYADFPPEDVSHLIGETS